jgi:hypothetical protein
MGRGKEAKDTRWRWKTGAEEWGAIAWNGEKSREVEGPEAPVTYFAVLLRIDTGDEGVIALSSTGLNAKTLSCYCT